jgi:hypothetical protein
MLSPLLFYVLHSNSVHIHFFWSLNLWKSRDWILSVFFVTERGGLFSWGTFIKHNTACVHSLLCRMKPSEEAKVYHHLEKPVLYTAINMHYVGVLYLNCSPVLKLVLVWIIAIIVSAFLLHSICITVFVFVNNMLLFLCQAWRVVLFLE